MMRYWKFTTRHFAWVVATDDEAVEHDLKDLRYSLTAWASSPSPYDPAASESRRQQQSLAAGAISFYAHRLGIRLPDHDPCRMDETFSPPEWTPSTVS